MLILGCGELPKAEPGLYLNEVLASNSSVKAEDLEHEQADWLEIYNGYETEKDLSGYFLSDKKSTPNRWAFPEGTKIAANGFLLVWADRQDTALHTNFKLSRSGGEIRLSSPTQELIDEVAYTTQAYDITYGRKYDGHAEWAYFDAPTPKRSNAESPAIANLEISSPPEFSVTPGFYEAGQKVELISEHEIRYTLDGSLPQRTSIKYSGAISLDQTQIIRAIAIEKGKLLSRAQTATYFIGEDKGLPIFSIVSDSVALWDTVHGIYEENLRSIERFANVE